MPALPLFEFEPGVSLQEFLDSVSFASTREKGRALFGRLAALPDNERAQEVIKLDAELRKRFRHSSFISFENFDTAVSIGALIFGIPYPPVAGLLKIGAQMQEAARKIPIVDKIIQDIEADLFSAFGKIKRSISFRELVAWPHLRKIGSPRLP